MKQWEGKPGAMLKTMFGAEIGGKGCRTVKQLPRAVYQRLPTAWRITASLCVELSGALAALDLSQCEKVVQALLRQLFDVLASPSSSSREAFVFFGGDSILLQVLFSPFDSQQGERGGSTTRIRTLYKDCLDILRELCCSVSFFADSLAVHGDYLLKCFSLMGNEVTFDSAVLLAEEILAVRVEILDLRDIENFTSLVQNLTSRQLVLFCRILAMVVFEPEDPKVVTGTDLGGLVDLDLVRTTVDDNHEAILEISGLLSRLTNLLYHYKLPSLSTGLPSIQLPARINSPVDNTNGSSDAEGHRFEISLQNELRVSIDDAAELDIDEEADFDFLDNLVDMAALIALPTPEIFNLSNQVEILFVMCALCGSKKRDQVQDTLAELDLIELLSHMFDKMDWTTSHDLTKSRGTQATDCACSPPAALKIQYLRLIHNFCDRDSCNKANKLLLFKPTVPLFKEDYFSVKIATPTCLDSFGNSKRQDGQRNLTDGLMIKIVKVLIQEPADSMFRFWIASCVEAFLRGADAEDQARVASTGLMEHLLNEILKGGFRCASSLQINFDLLGELIKFNHILFARFSRLLDGEKFEKFVEVLVTNLVDSNVFIRSVLLSLEAFRNCCGQGLCKGNQRSRQLISPDSRLKQANSLGFHCGSDQYLYDEEWYQIGTFITHNEFRLLRDLMSAVPLGDVNQDNICVLNTALIMFILADRNGELRSYLQALRTEQFKGARNCQTLQRFRHLLKFWQGYYLRKTGRDSLSLQYSTNIPFEEWLRVVNLLCHESELPTNLNDMPIHDSSSTSS